ncbi:MFS transporter [Actinomadura sp. DC4]|uniref:MFS transporter n=1 Tax=Actinomadura sp. DC4 TaxID=3055069 RepID=UPI0025AED057|nr:MFS transporter [Actinomadura sp. DC4]MDN3359633.1 MFS transporter [Actinomadura sp. DC4]
MVRYRDLFTVREFRYLYAGLIISYVGDQLAAVAVAVLVFNRTDSGLLTGLAYASAFLPALAGPVLGAYADRLPRRALMVACDLARAVFIAALVIPGMPIWLMIVLLFAGHSFAPAFVAARSAILPEILDGEQYIAGNGLRTITGQLCQVVGAAGGGMIVALVGSTTALTVDAATFVASAAITVYGVRSRPAPTRSGRSRTVVADSRDGLRYVFGDRWLRTCLLLVWFVPMFAFAPEAIIYPYAKELNGGATTAGLILASSTFGFACGAVVMTRALAPLTRLRLVAPFAMVAGAILIPLALEPPLPVVLLLFYVSGAGSAFAAPLNALFVRRADKECRGRAMGIAIAGIAAGQGCGFLLAGALVDTGMHPPRAIALLGTGAAVSAIATAPAWRRADMAGRATIGVSGDHRPDSRTRRPVPQESGRARPQPSPERAQR